MGTADNRQHALADDGKSERFLGREVVMQSPTRHTRRVYQILHRGRKVTLHLESLRRDIENARAHALGIIPAWYVTLVFHVET
jgi:hypothetical protein